MKHHEKWVLRTLIRKEYHLVVSRLTCTLHPYLQFLTYTVHFSIAVLNNRLWYDQTLDRNCTLSCILRDHGLASCNPYNTFQGHVNGAHSEPPFDAHSEPSIPFSWVKQMVHIRSHLLTFIRSRLLLKLSAAHTEPSSAHIEPSDAHTELLDLFCHFHDNFLDKHHMIVLNEGCFWFELCDIIWWTRYIIGMIKSTNPGS